MPAFPSLTPSTRILTPGSKPSTAGTSLNGRRRVVGNGNGSVGGQLQLTFLRLLEAEKNTIVAHYHGQAGALFSIAGISNEWFYLRLKIIDYSGPPPFYDVTVTLGLARQTAAVLNGLNLAIQYTLTGGIADLQGLSQSITYSLTGGQIELGILPGLSEQVTYSLTGGDVEPAGIDGLSEQITYSLTGGEIILNGLSEQITYSLTGGEIDLNGLSQVVTYSLTGGDVNSSATDPYFSSVSLLLHMDGSNNSTTFLDSSSNSLSVTTYGNAKISTNQSKFGVSSGLFDGSGDYLALASSALFNVSNISFTAELWFSCLSVSGYTQRSLISQRISGDITTFDIQTQNNQLVWLIGNNNLTSWAAVNTSGSLLSVNTWYHLAFVSTGSTLKLYLNGVQVFTLSQPQWPSANRPLYIGNGGDGGFNGYIDEVRFTKGVARYTANFTPPTDAFPNS